MKRLNTSELTPGMVTAEDVYTYTNQLLVPKGSVLNDKSITKLEFYSIINVRVEDELSKEFLSEPQMPEDVSYSEKIKKSPEFIAFKAKFDEEVPKFQRMLDEILEYIEIIN